MRLLIGVSRRPALALVAWAGCAFLSCASEAQTNRASGVAGDWQTIEYRAQLGGCGTPTPTTVPPEDEWFRLSDEEVAGAALVGYRRCIAKGQCDEIFDLARSVGRSAEPWSLYVSSAGGDPCRLSYRLRLLERVDDTTIRFRVLLHQELAPELTGAACKSAEATTRGIEMPCVEERVWIARRR